MGTARRLSGSLAKVIKFLWTDEDCKVVRLFLFWQGSLKYFDSILDILDLPSKKPMPLPETV